MSVEVSTLNGREYPSSVPRLLTLPAEIRNLIYRMCLVSDDNVEVSSFPVSEPAIMDTCRQIRQESAGIYYTENKFTIHFTDWDFSVYQPLFHYVHGLLGEDKMHKFFWIWKNPGSYRCKDNLINLLKVYHEDKVLHPFSYQGHQSRSRKTTASMGAFEIVKSMREQPWSVVEKVLNVYLNEVAKKSTSGWKWK